MDRLFDKIMIAIEDTAPEDIQRQKTLADILQKLQTINEFKTPQDLAEQKARIAALKTAARQTGSTLSDPFASLSFLALPVIPALKLTDRGLFAL